MAFLDPYVDDIQEYLSGGDYGSALRYLLQNRAVDATGNRYGFSPSYMSSMDSQAGLLGTLFDVLSGTDRLAEQTAGPRKDWGTTAQFQDLFRSYTQPQSYAGAGLRQQALQALFANDDAARKYEEGFFGGGRTAPQLDSSYNQIIEMVAALLSNKLSSSALRTQFLGDSARSRIIDGYRSLQNNNQSFTDYLYSMFSKYLGPIKRAPEPAKPTTKPTPTKPVVDEMKPGDTKTPIMNRNTGPENNPILSSQTDWENMRKQKPLKFLGAV